jgi:uncharacterized RDD family membrane protein YckC
MSQWYYSDYERNRLGPVAASDLAELHHAGQLRPDTLVWREGMPQWRAWREVMAQALNEAAGRTTPEAVPLSAGVNPYAMAEPLHVAPAAAVAAGGAPSLGTLSANATLGAGANPYAMAEPLSPYAPPRAAVHGGTDYVADGHVVYAGFWKRVAASVIDSFVLMVVIFILAMAIGVSGAVMGSDPARGLSGTGMATLGLFYLLEIVGLALYFAMMHASGLQATLGKLAVGIKVVDDDGDRISFWRGIGRYFAYLLSSFTLCIGYILAAFTDRKRALHDMMCSTLVVDRWAYTSHPERQREELGTVTIVVLVLGALAVIAYIGLIVALVASMAAMGH